MKKLLLSLTILLGLCVGAQAQCIAVGGINNVPQPGMVCLSEPIAPTFIATGIGIVPAASATDIACITGSASQIVRVQAIRVSGTGTAITIPVIIKKNASADSGGTAAVTTALPVPGRLDSSIGAAPTATTISYTANPTINDTTPLVVDVQNLFLAATTTSTAMPGVLFDWSGRTFSEAPTLRGVAQQLCVSLNATSPTALINVSFRWTELVQ